MSKEEKDNDLKVVAYVLETSPVIYIGVLESGTDVINDPRFLMKKVLMQMHISVDPKAPGKKEILWSPPMAAGKDSLIVVDRNSQPGILVFDPDSRLVDDYKKELAKIYSGIHLL